MTTVLFVCLRNAGRSQIAEAIFNAKAGGRAAARSAGSEPAQALHPEVAAVLAEIGLDVSGARPKGLTPEVLRGVDVVVRMGCGDACPAVPGARTLDWDLPDPEGKPLEAVRAIRDEIARRVDDLLRDLLSSGSGSGPPGAASPRLAVRTEQPSRQGSPGDQEEHTDSQPQDQGRHDLHRDVAHPRPQHPHQLDR